MTNRLVQFWDPFGDDTDRENESSSDSAKDESIARDPGAMDADVLPPAEGAAGQEGDLPFLPSVPPELDAYCQQALPEQDPLLGEIAPDPPASSDLSPEAARSTDGGAPSPSGADRPPEEEPEDTQLTLFAPRRRVDHKRPSTATPGFPLGWPLPGARASVLPPVWHEGLVDVYIPEVHAYGGVLDVDLALGRVLVQRDLMGDVDGPHAAEVEHFAVTPAMQFFLGRPGTAGRRLERFLQGERGAELASRYLDLLRAYRTIGGLQSDAPAVPPELMRRPGSENDGRADPPRPREVR